MNNQNNFNNPNNFNNFNNNNVNNGFYTGNPFPEDEPVEENKNNGKNLVLIIIAAIVVIGLIIFGFIMLLGNRNGNESQGEINFLVSDVTLTKGESNVLSYRISNMSEDTPISFESSNEEVAVVNSNGKVTAIGEGTATITAKYKVNGETMTKNIEVTVEPSQTSSSSSSSSTKTTKDTTPPLVKLDGDKTQFTGEGSVRVCATCSDTGSGCKEETVCKTFTKSATNQQITVYDNEGNKTTSKYFNVTVTAVKDTKAVTSVTLDKTKGTLMYGSSVASSSKTVTLKATITPSTATNKNVTWKSSNEKVAKVDKNGKVTAVGKGTATITVTTEDGKKTDTYKVTVKQCLWKKGTTEKNISSCKATYDAKKLPSTAKTGDKLYSCEVASTSYGIWTKTASCKCTKKSYPRSYKNPKEDGTCSKGDLVNGKCYYTDCIKGWKKSNDKTKCEVTGAKTITEPLSKISVYGKPSVAAAKSAVISAANTKCSDIAKSKNQYSKCENTSEIVNDYSVTRKYNKTTYTYTCS